MKSRGRLTAIVGGTGPEDPVLRAIAARITDGPVVRFDGVLGLVGAVRAHVAQAGPLAALDVVGHASAGALALSGQDPAELLGVCHRSFGYLVQLRAQGALPDGAPVTFVGCEIAARCVRDRTLDGPLVLLAVARYLGCPVAGTTRSISVEDFDERGLTAAVRDEHTLQVMAGSSLPADGWLSEVPALPGAPLAGRPAGRVMPPLRAARPDVADALEDDAWFDGDTLLDRPGPALDVPGLDARVTLDGRGVVVHEGGRRLVARVRRGGGRLPPG